MKWLSVILALVSMPAFAQQASPAPAKAAPQPPVLDTAFRIAVQTMEKQKSDASVQWNNANQQEITVEREWNMEHPGWQVDTDALQKGIFAVIPDTMTAPKPEVNAPAPTGKEPAKKR